MKSNYIFLMNNAPSAGDLGLGIGGAALNSVAPGVGTAVVSIIKDLFGNKPNPNDWQGWDAQDQQAGFPPLSGRSAIWWTITDGDSVVNEANNVLSFINNAKQGDLSFMVDQVTPAQLKSKLDRAGHTRISQNMANQLQVAINAKYAAIRTQTVSDKPDAAYSATNVASDAASSAKNSPGSSNSNWPMIIGIVLAILIVVVLAIVFLRKKTK